MSEHFALEEFLASDTARAQGIENLPSWDTVDNLNRLAVTLELVRDMLGGVPVLVSSGFRCAALNAAVGGVADSAHLAGLAVDFTAPDFGSVADICKKLQPHLIALEVDQLINEGGWVHLGLSDGPPRYQCFAV